MTMAPALSRKWTVNPARTRYSRDFGHGLVVRVMRIEGVDGPLWRVVVFGQILYSPAKNAAEGKVRAVAEARRRLQEVLLRTSGSI